jgi:hypothetical protein
LLLLWRFSLVTSLTARERKMWRQFCVPKNCPTTMDKTDEGHDQGGLNSMPSS